MSENMTRMQAKIAPWPSIAVGDGRNGITFAYFQFERGGPGEVVIYRGDATVAVLAECDMDRVCKWLNHTLDAAQAEREAQGEAPHE